MNTDSVSSLKLVVSIGQEFARQRFCWIESLKYCQAEGTIPRLVSNNFFDIALLNWAHLFGNNRDRLHFRKVLSRPDDLKENVKIKLSINDFDWDANWNLLQDFRNTRVAHIDSTKNGEVPNLDFAFECVSEYYFIAREMLQAKNTGVFVDSYMTLVDFSERNSLYFTDSVRKLFSQFE